MNTGPRICPFEDAVLLCFVDAVLPKSSAEPGHDTSTLARHLEDCPRCRQVLDESKSLDALLASQTSTEITDEEVERLLAFRERSVQGEALRRFSAQGSRASVWNNKLVPGLLGLAAMFALVLWLRDFNLPDSTGPAELPKRLAEQALFLKKPRLVIEKTLPKVEAGRTTSVFATEGIPVADTASKRGTKGKRKTKPSALDYLANFSRRRSRYVPGQINARQLFSEAERILGNPFPFGILSLRRQFRSGPHGFLPTHSAAFDERMSSRDALALAAATWILEGIAQGRRGLSALRLPIEELLLAEGLERRLLLRLFRSQQAVVSDWLAKRFARKAKGQDPEPPSLGLLGAVGLSGHERKVLALSNASLAYTARQARQSADQQSLAFLVDLYLDLSLRYPDKGKRATIWFDDLSRHDARIIQASLEERIAKSRHFERRQLSLQLMRQLGLGLEGALSADSPH